MGSFNNFDGSTNVGSAILGANISPIKTEYRVLVNGRPLVYRRHPVTISISLRTIQVNLGKENLSEKEFERAVMSRLNAPMSDVSGEVIFDSVAYPVSVEYDSTIKIISIFGGWYAFLKRVRSDPGNFSGEPTRFSQVGVMGGVWKHISSDGKEGDIVNLSGDRLKNVMNTFLSYQLLMARDMYYEGIYSSLFVKRLPEKRYLINYCTIPLLVNLNPVLDNPLVNDFELSDAFMRTKLSNLVSDNYTFSFKGSSVHTYTYSLAVMNKVCRSLGVGNMIIPASVVFSIVCYVMDRDLLLTGRHTLDYVLEHINAPHIRNKILERNGTIFEDISEFSEKLIPIFRGSI